MKKNRYIALIISIITILIGLFCIWPIAHLSYFAYWESRAIQSFDALNEEIFENLLPPDGVAVIKQYSVGIDSPSTTHGRYLRTEYQRLEANSSDVLKHYKELLLLQGWHENVSYTDYYSYSRGTACVNINFYGKYYSISVWHDFWKQDFSPPYPNMKLLNFVELGLSNFVTCPP
jgi:hypothetical protein